MGLHHNLVLQVLRPFLCQLLRSLVRRVLRAGAGVFTRRLVSDLLVRLLWYRRLVSDLLVGLQRYRRLVRDY